MRLVQVRGTELPVQRNVVAAEYSLNTPVAPGAGTPLALSAGPDPSLSVILPVAALGVGLHKVFLRFKDASGRWSAAEMRLFRTSPTWSPQPLPQITAAEAFVDTDPGAGNGTALDLAAGPDVSILDQLDSAPLAGGFHTVGVRVRDNLGRWSQVEKRLTLLRPVEPPTEQPQVTAAEVFVDSDPGPGNGAPLTVGPGGEVNLAEGVDVSTVAPGLHTLNLRVRDDSGRWSQREARLFIKHEYIDPGEGQLLAAAEYFINYDPGPGHGVAIPLPVDGAWDDTLETVEALVNGVPVGRHWLGMRFRDSWGAWSSTVADSFLVGPLLTIQPATLPATLTWEGDLVGDVIKIYRASSINGPWSLVHTTTDAGWIDPENPAAPAKRWYKVTQEAAAPLASFRLPEPTDAGAVPNRPAKRPWGGASTARSRD